MVEIFTTLESFSAYIIALTALAILSIVFEEKLIALEDMLTERIKKIKTTEVFSHEDRGAAKSA